jgi:hypothetical protein
MQQKLLALCGLLLLAACSPGGAPDREKAARFRTTPPSQLYFKNTRSFHYEQSPWKDTRMQRYKLRKFSGPERSPRIVPVILDNWMQDEAYLWFESPAGKPLDRCRLHWRHPRQEESGSYLLDNPTPAGYSRLGLSLYESLRQGHELRVEGPDSTFMPLFPDAEARSAFFTVLRDYFKLVEAR